MALHAVITAAGPVPPQLKHLADGEAKALLRVGGQTLLSAALEAAEGLPGVDSVAAVGHGEVRTHLPAGVRHVLPGADLADNLHRGFMAAGGSDADEFLLISPDLPFVTAAVLTELLQGARASSEFALPIVSAAAFRSLYPDCPNSFVNVGGVEYTLGSSFYMTGRMLRTNIPLIRDFVRMRKSPLKLAALLGLPVAFGLLTGRLSIPALERRAEQLTGGTVRALPMAGAAIACDVDTLANYEYAEKWLGGTQGRS